MFYMHTFWVQLSIAFLFCIEGSMNGDQPQHNDLQQGQVKVEEEDATTAGTGLELQLAQMLAKEFRGIDPIAVCTRLAEFLRNFVNQLKGETHYEETNTGFRPVYVKSEEGAEIIYPSRKTKWVRNITKEQQKQKYEEQKFIAFSFCEHGVNFHYITLKYPDMSPKAYRCMVEAVNNQTVNEIVEFLRYECNVQVEKLNRDQKRSIRTQLTKIREWLGNRDPKQLETFYRFIYRHYDKSIEIKFEEALQIYKTIVQIIKSPFVNVLEAAEGDDPEKKEEDGCINMEDEKAMIICFIKHKDLNRVADDLCQKYGYDVRWSLHSVKVKMREILTKSLDKLLSNFKNESREVYSNYITPKRREILQESNEIDLKLKLYSYYLEKKTSYVKVKDLLQRLREFFEIYGGDSTEASLPKLEKTYFSEFDLEEEGSGEFQMMETVKKEELTDNDSISELKKEE